MTSLEDQKMSGSKAQAGLTRAYSTAHLPAASLARDVYGQQVEVTCFQIRVRLSEGVTQFAVIRGEFRSSLQIVLGLA